MVCTNWAQISEIWLNTFYSEIVCILLHLEICPMWYPSANRTFISRNDNFPKGLWMEFFNCPNVCSKVSMSWFSICIIFRWIQVLGYVLDYKSFQSDKGLGVPQSLSLHYWKSTSLQVCQICATPYILL